MLSDIKFRYILVSELESFVESEEYKNFNFLPISKLRALSHANNPRANHEDLALILAIKNSDLIAYLGTLPDLIFQNNSSQKVAWYSCLYVLPEYRRSGLAMQMVDRAYEHYRGFICISNYHPPSKGAFLKTGKYKEVKVLEGIRCYLRFNTRELIAGRKKSLGRFREIFTLTDGILNIFTDRYFKYRFAIEPASVSFEEIDLTQEATQEVINRYTRKSPFKRIAAEFQWMLNFPWINTRKNDELEADKYYFSLYSPDFRQYALQITQSGDKVVGVLMLTLHKNQLNIPYLLVEETYYSEVYQYIYQLMLRHRIPTLVCHHKDFAIYLQKRRKDFITQRSSEFGFMTTQNVMDFLNNSFGSPFCGDGDGAFT